MSQVSGSLSEEERSLFRPFTRESLVAIDTRIAEELAKQKELEKKRAESDVSTWSPKAPFLSFSLSLSLSFLSEYIYIYFRFDALCDITSVIYTPPHIYTNVLWLLRAFPSYRNARFYSVCDERLMLVSFRMPTMSSCKLFFFWFVCVNVVRIVSYRDGWRIEFFREYWNKYLEVFKGAIIFLDEVILFIYRVFMNKKLTILTSMEDRYV